MTIPVDFTEDLGDPPSDDDWEDLNPGLSDDPLENLTTGDGSGDKFRGVVADSDTLAEFIKRPKTAVAREYEKKTAAALNSIFRGAAGNPGTVVDAATILVFGDGFSAAAGELAQEDEKARKVLDFICTPSNPWVAFAMVAIPMAAQLMRNHETELEDLPPVKKVIGIKIPFSKKAISIPLRIKPRLPRRLRSQTSEPAAMLAVFEHPDVKRALKKRGITVADEVQIGKKRFRRA
jgi:hypothetical protein